MKRNKNEIIERICAIGISVLTIVIMAFLWGASVIWTHTFWNTNTQEYTDAFMPRIRDGIKGNLIFCFVAICLLIAIYTGVKKYIRSWQIKLFLFLEMIAMVGFSWIYVCDLQAMQWADFSQIIITAQQFIDGDFSLFTPGEYIATYPHQLGLVSLFAGIIKLTGGAGKATSVFQFMNCLCVGGILLNGYRAVNNMWRKKEINAIYLLIQGLCFPLYFYTPLVYGELISIMFLMVSTAQLAKILYTLKITAWDIIVIIVSAGLAVSFRKNSLIILIAMGIVIVITAIKSKRWKINILLITLIAGMTFPVIIEKGIYGRYNQNASMPAIMWIYIGLQNGSGFGYGAYDGKAGTLFKEAGYAPDVAAEMAKEEIADRIAYFREDPQSGLEFFREKILWQWISPSYMCFSNTRFTQEGYPVGVAYSIVEGDAREAVTDLMDAFQSLVYLLMIIGAFGIVRKRDNFMSWIWSLSVVGGFLFSILWEAKTRYTYPYFVMMIPTCAYGIYFLGEKICKTIVRIFCVIKHNSSVEVID
ncbi:MAG: hypothetical protein IJZ44_09150 [Lachnospiraceae bacterium]|nr:hypothetical protein [Lachnospiraceae bacterium]